jgi:hypothetical protein
VSGTVRDKDYPGSRPRGGGLLHPATTHYNGAMCTDCNDGVGRYSICYVLASRAPPRWLIKAPSVGITAVPWRILHRVLD